MSIPTQTGLSCYTGSTKDAVLQLLASVNTSTSAPIAEKAATLWRNAPIHLIGLEPARPKFHHGLLWTLDEDGHSPTALSTLYDTPLPRPQPNEFHPVVLNTIARNPLLFKLITPINIETFEVLLSSHPNQPFIKSVLTGLCEGFWPFVNTHADSYPPTHDASLGPPKSEKQRQFLTEQCNIEIVSERFSPPFGTDLLPGMYSMPVHAVPKVAGSDKLHLVVDHSASSYSLNSMIMRDDIAGAHLDTIKDLANSIIQFRRQFGNVKLVLFKSDVSAAYRRLPMHPLWQIKQIITIDGQ